MPILQNMIQKQQELQEQFDLFSQKISRLRKALAIETDPSNKFKLKKQLEDAEAEREQVEQHLAFLEREIRTHHTSTIEEANTKETNEPTSSLEKHPQPLSPGRYALISFIAFVVGGVLLWLYIFKAGDLIVQGIDEKVFYLLLIPLGFSAAAFLFGVMGSYATYTGNILRGVLELGGPVIIFLLVVIGGFKLVPETTPFPLTVYVRDSEGEIVLKNEGSVILELGGEPQERKIGDYGDTYFRQIPAKFRKQPVSIELDAEGFELAYPEKEHLLTGDSIAIEIKRDDSLAKVFGTVRDTEGQPVNDVLVRIGDVSTTTREDGRFTLDILSEKQQKQQTLTVYKDGYREWESFVYPATGQEVKIVLEKR